MSRRVSHALVGLVLLIAPQASANEGQWKPDQVEKLDRAELEKLGLELTAEQLWNADGDEKTGGLMRASVNLSGCSAAFVSPDGLIATMYVLLPVVAQTFGLGYAQVGVLRAVHAGAMSLLELPSGMLAERVGERPLLVLGLLLSGIGYLCLAAADGRRRHRRRHGLGAHPSGSYAMAAALA